MKKINTVGDLRKLLSYSDDEEPIVFTLEDNQTIECKGASSSAGGRITVLWFCNPGCTKHPDKTTKRAKLMEAKIKALAEFLKCSPDDLEQANHDANLFEYGVESYLVLDDEEADKYAHERIMDSLWAFNAEFILSNSRIEIDENNEDDILKALKAMQEKLCENANPLVRALLKDEEDFVEAAVAADGRGHFLSNYDNEENEVSDEEECFYIYRQN